MGQNFLLDRWIVLKFLQEFLEVIVLVVDIELLLNEEGFSHT